MRITKQGIPPAQTIWKGVCSVCATEAEAAQSELRIQHPLRGDGEPFATATCPVCGTDCSMKFYKSSDAVDHLPPQPQVKPTFPKPVTVKSHFKWR